MEKRSEIIRLEMRRQTEGQVENVYCCESAGELPNKKPLLLFSFFALNVIISAVVRYCAPSFEMLYCHFFAFLVTLF